MSAFREAYRAMVENALICPRCKASNRPRATYIELDESGARAYCTVCSASGPLETFQQPKENA